MSAKEMFEELGYEQIKHNVFDEKPRPNEFITQDEPYILYRQKNENAVEDICFKFYSKRVWVSAYIRKLGRVVETPLSYKELQAINKQVKELGWLGDKEE